jgi:DNA repair protein RecN (Recombination protein N)
MLAIKSVTGKRNKLPTVIFDEIDTGVSGEVAEKMGKVMKDLGKTMQVFSITHLPQVAVKADVHYKVVKENIKDKTISKMVLLGKNEREEEIAKMLSGEKITFEALANARALLK